MKIPFAAVTLALAVGTGAAVAATPAPVAPQTAKVGKKMTTPSGLE
jgi:hypothetical protein